MALVFGDSFDHYPTADILKKWTAQYSVAGTSIVNTSGVPLPPHTSCLYVQGNSGYISKSLPATQTTFIVGTWFKTFNTAANNILQFLDGSTEHCSLRLDATGHLTFTRNATVLATSANTISANTWYHIEVKATIGDAGDTPSGRYQVKVNGTDWIADSGTGQDTRNGGNQYITTVAVACSSGSSQANYFQDLYVLNTTGTQASDFLGPCRFQVLRPVGAGNSAQWTGNYADNWQNVSEGMADGDATFNQSSTANQIDLFTMSDVPSGTVHAIQHVIQARKDAGAARSIRPKTRIGGTNYDGTTVSLAATHSFYTEAVQFSPATGGSTAWDDDELNGAEFGYELIS